MKKEEELLRNLTELIRDTQSGQVNWDVLCQTTEYNEAETKRTKNLDGVTWLVDECFVSYHCIFRRKEFIMITYEEILTSGGKKQSTNMVFLPPLGLRFFDVDRLAPYAVPANQMLVYEVHMLWLAILERYKSDPGTVALEVNRREE